MPSNKVAKAAQDKKALKDARLGRINSKHVAPLKGKGTGNRKRDTEEVKRRLEELGFDPLQFVTAVAKGEALTKNHPFLSIASSRLTQWLQRIANEQTVNTEDIEEFRDDLIKALTDSWTPIDIRNRNALELIKYIHPQLKSQDMNILRNNIQSGAVTKLLKKEVKDFTKWWKENY